MKRRAVLGAFAGSAVAATAGCLGGRIGSTMGAGGSNAGASGGAGGGGSAGDLPLTVDTLDAPGSSAGEVRVPVADAPTVLDLFATWCGPCRAQMESLATLHDEYGGDVAFVSVTNERFGGGLDAAGVREWWREQRGDWTVGHDPEGRLMRAVRADGLPFLVVFDAGGSTSWTHRGLAGEAAVRSAIEDVL